MKTYYFFLNLGKQRQDLGGKFVTKVITCLDPEKDGLARFVDAIHEDGRFKAIENDIFYKEL